MPRVFISHSSLDKEIIGLFKDIILKGGLGLSDADIFCTSFPETGIPIGENIPAQIKQNLLDCEYAFLMISENYKKSEVCLNEMGAVMVLGRRLFPILLYNFNFDKVGWLIDKNLCIKVEDRERLDEIRDVLYDDGIKSITSVWNRSCEKFLNSLSELPNYGQPQEIKGLLDYQLEMESSQENYNKYLDSLNEYTNTFIQQSKEIIDNHNASADLHERRAYMKQLADLLHEFSDYIDATERVVISALRTSLEAARGIIKLETVHEGDKESLRRGLSGFKQSCTKNMEYLRSGRANIAAQLDLVGPRILAKYRVLNSIDTFISGYDESIKEMHNIIVLR